MVSGNTSGVPSNATRHMGLTRKVQTSLHGLSFGACNSKLSACDSADSHVNSPASVSKLAGTRMPPLVSTPPVSTDSPAKTGISKVNPPRSGAIRSTRVATDHSRPRFNSLLTLTHAQHLSKPSPPHPP